MTLRSFCVTFGREIHFLSNGFVVSHVKIHRIFANGVKKNAVDRRSIGKTQGGLNGKLNLVDDWSGKPVHLHLSSSNLADIAYVCQCIEPYVAKGCVIIVDLGYDVN